MAEHSAAPSDALSAWRARIDALDGNILRLLNQRATAAHTIGQIKQADGAPAKRPEREAELIARLSTANHGPLDNAHIRRIYTEVMSACLALEADIRVAYLGPKGTYSEQAARQYFGQSAEFSPSTTIDEVFRAVQSGRATYGMVPIENSYEGAVNPTLDNLIRMAGTYLCGEYYLKIDHCLLSREQAISDIDTIYAHPQSLAQCKTWLAANTAQTVRIIPTDSNGAAMQKAAETARSAAIGGIQNQALYGLTALATSIQDDLGNTTRFAVLGNHTVAPARSNPAAQTDHKAANKTANKTSIVLEFDNRIGGLANILNVFSEANIDLSRITSRPSLLNRWQYVFYIDLAGHMEDAPIAAALDRVKALTHFFKWLGSYPRDTTA